MRQVLQRGQLPRRLLIGAAEQPVEQRRALAGQVLQYGPWRERLNAATMLELSKTT